MKIDYWYKNRDKKIAKVDVFFYPNEGVYRGNIYDVTGKIIGDYSTKDSVELQERFPFVNFGA